MREVILMTVQHTLDDLFKKSLSSILIKLLKTVQILKQLSSLQIFHNNNHFHVTQSETFMNFYDIRMIQRFQYLRFHKNSVYITDRSNFLRLDNLYSEILVGLLVTCQINSTEASFSQQLHHLILCITARRIKLLPF